MTRKQAILARSFAAVIAIALSPGVARANDMAEMRTQIQALTDAMKEMQQHQLDLEKRLEASEAARAAAVAANTPTPNAAAPGAVNAPSGQALASAVPATSPASPASVPGTPADPYRDGVARPRAFAAEKSVPREQLANAEALHAPPGTIGPNPLYSNNPSSPGKGASIVIPGTDTIFRFGGMIKVDAYDDVSGANLNTVPTDGVSIPLNGTTQARRKGQLMITARQTRFGIGSETPTSLGTLRSFIEGDFYGTAGTALITNPVAPRLRQAYLSLGKWLVGQTWSVFFDLESAPETLDLTGPVGNAYAIRQPLIRYQTPLGRRGQLTLGIENPDGDFLGADQTTNFPIGATLSTRVLNQIPDFTARYTYKTDRVRISAAGLVRDINLDTGGASLPFLGPNGTFYFAGHARSWAFAGQLDASIKTWGQDSFMVGVNGGPGIGRYLMAPQDAAFALGVAPNGATNANPGNGAVLGLDGKLRSIFSWGAVMSYRHLWSKTLRSNLTLGYQHIGDPDATLPINFPDNLTSIHANLIWSPLPQIGFGIEYVRETLDLRGQTDANRALGYGDKGEMNRIQFSAQYNLF